MATGRTNDGVGFATARWLDATFAGHRHPLLHHLHHFPPPGAAGVEQRAFARWGLASERTRADVHAMLAQMHGGPVFSFRTALAGGNAAMQQRPD